jgi:hypothetical protein
METPEQVLEVQIDKIAAHLLESDSLVPGLGIEFGTVGADGEGEAVKWAGCGKILGSL